MRVWAKKVFCYNDQWLEKGEIFELIGARNDQKLLDFGHCAEVKGQVLNCTCGKSFFLEPCLREHQAGAKHPKEPIVLVEDKPKTGRPKKVLV